MVKPFLRYMNLDQRQQIVEAKVLSIPMYGIALYIGQNQLTKDRLTTIFMRAYKEIYAKYVPLKTKNDYICRQVKMKTPRQVIVQEALKFISKVINTQRPGQIFKMISFPRRPRKNARLEIDRAPRTVKCRRSLLYKSLRQFNNLHSSLKFLHPKIFKKIIVKRKILEVPDD